MSKGPVHEIFSHNALEKTNMFQFDGQESVEQTKLNKKDVMAPMAPMKKFGGYKPKIFSGEGTNGMIENDSGLSLDTSLLKRKTKPAPGLPEEAPRVALTKRNPFVIGDNNVPMVLTTLDDTDHDDSGAHLNQNNINGNLGDELNGLRIYNTVIENEVTLGGGNVRLRVSLDSLSTSETATSIFRSNDKRNNHGLDHSTEDLQSPTLENRVPMSNSHAGNNGFPSLSNSDDMSRVQSPNNGNNDEPEGVFIPAPDYDEEEQSLDFTEEESDGNDGGGGRQRPRQQKHNKPLIKQYEGQDLSHYISDDEGEAIISQATLHNQKARKGTLNKHFKTVPRPKVNDRNSLSKPPPLSKRKGSAKGKAPVSNSVRSFSYSDSKYGTKGRSAGKSPNTTFSEFGDDSEMFLQAYEPSGSYESFLRSRHGDVMAPPESSDSGVEMGDDAIYAQLRPKEEPFWKKLTLRLKNRMSKDIKDY